MLDIEIEGRIFTVKPEHLKLIRAMNFSLSCEYPLGSVEQNPKRPYGDSDVLESVAEVLGIRLFRNDDEEIKPKQAEVLEDWHRGACNALAVCAGAGFFGTGEFEYIDGGWAKVEDGT